MTKFPAALLGVSIAMAVHAAPALAQEGQVKVDASLLDACMSEAKDTAARQACIGKASDPCMETSDGQTTIGMSECLKGEAKLWDTRLNDVYGSLMKKAEAADKELTESGSAAPAESAALLKKAEQNWISYREATCAYDMSLFQGGTGAGPSGNACIMRLTANQAILLQSYLDTMDM